MASGLTPKGEALYHWDIYALLYAPRRSTLATRPR